MITDPLGLPALPLDQPIVCPVLIGRNPHLDALLRCIDDARSGQGRVILVSGEAGIGKSRLVTEAVERARLSGVRVLAGHCFEPDRSLPYAPLQDLLQAILNVQSLDAIADALGSDGNGLSALLPDLADLPSATPIEPEQEKRRLFVALTRLLIHLASVDPLMIAIEDVHWSDDASLDFVEYLSHRIAGHPIALLLTFRTDEISTRLSSALVELDRARVASEVRLTRLRRADTATMVRATAGGRRPVPPALIDTIYGLTDGNPFFIEEIVRSLVADAIGPAGEVETEQDLIERLRIPRSIEDSVRRRFELLTSGARQTVTLAAVAGRRFDLKLLQAMQGGKMQDLVAQLKELLSAQLIVEEVPDRFAFRHALTRQAIYSRLLSLERGTYHRTILETIERSHADAIDAYLADLSYHAFAAAEWQKSLDYGRRAGEAALHLHAARAAIDHFGRAISAAQELARSHGQAIYGRADLERGASPDLFRRRGHAYQILGEFDRARSDLETALALARAAADRAAEWQGLVDLGFLWAERDYAKTGDFYRRASDLAAGIADPILHARSLNRLGNWLTNVGRAEEALSAHREALTLFGANGSARGEAETLDLLGMTWGLAIGDPIESAAHFDQAIALIRAFDDTAALVSSLTGRAAFCNPNATETLFSPLTQRDECEALLQEACALARQNEMPAALAFAEYVLGQTLSGYGEFGAALVHAGEGLRIAIEIDHQQWQCGGHTMLGVAYVGMLDPERAVPHLEAARDLGRGLGSAWWTGIASAYLALGHLLAGAPSRAASILADAMPPDRLTSNAGERRTVWAWGELALARGNPEEALRIAEELLASAPGETGSQPIPTLLRLKGEALLALRRMDEAGVALENAKVGAIQRGATPLLWQIHRALARLRLASRQPGSAQQESAAAREIIAVLGASFVDDTERDRFVQRAIASLPALPRPTSSATRQRDMERFGGLTRREREVAAQIALGKSNREIAASLFTAERTVASQIGSILAKLGFSSRAQIAIWAREHHLPEPE